MDDTFDQKLLQRMRRYDRDAPADQTAIEIIADELGTSVAKVGRRLRALRRAGIVAVRHGVYAWDPEAAIERKVGGNRTLKRAVPGGYLPTAMRQSMATKALAALIALDADARADGGVTLRRLDAAIAKDPIPMAEALRVHDRRAAKGLLGLIDWMGAARHSWKHYDSGVIHYVEFDEFGAGKWVAETTANWCLRQAIVAGWGRCRIGSAENSTLVTVGQLATDADLAAAGLGTPDQIRDRRTSLRRLGWALRAEGPSPTELDPVAAAFVAARDASLTVDQRNGKARFFLSMDARR